jgi:lipopolysaccharide export system protein LptA
VKKNVLRFLGLAVAAGCGVIALAAGGSSAKSSGEGAPLNYEADKGQADLNKKRYTLQGHVRVTQGALEIQAQEAVLQQSDSGFSTIVVTGAATEPARFEQKNEATHERMTGQGQRIDYDSQKQLLTLQGDATLRRYQGQTLVDEVVGAVITYNRSTEAFQVDGQTTAKPGNAGAGGGGGRVRGVLTPASASSK